MSSPPFSPPPDVNTRTTTTLSIVRARPEHVDAIHEIQLLAYPGRTDFHESKDIFQSKLESYPAGNFIALATYSVLTNSNTDPWSHLEENEKDPGATEEVVEDNLQADDSTSRVSVVEIEVTETGPDESTITTSSTASRIPSGQSMDYTLLDTLRARTPDITEESDDDSLTTRRQHGKPSSSSSRPPKGSNLAVDSTFTTEHQGDQDDDDEEDNMTTVLFQWERPVGYLFSHPYSRESATLHHIGTGVRSEGPDSQGAPSRSKKMKMDPHLTESTSTSDSEAESESVSETGPFDHDQWMEKYFVHDCAIHPEWQGKGLASRLWKTLEASLIPTRQADLVSGKKKDFVDTEEEDTDTEDAHDTTKQDQEQTPHQRKHVARRGSKKSHQRKGAPNLKEIVLVSVQGTRPFWEGAGGFQVVKDHDLDLAVYGDEAYLMSKHFFF